MRYTNELTGVQVVTEVPLRYPWRAESAPAPKKKTASKSK